ncbi:MAG: hypothetical protein C0444_08025 [Microbacterium sp.]|nr:hypothetical protein [Microbacterium sp.]MBA4344908.1 hypothetical protein [Microbacterium sp.]
MATGVGLTTAVPASAASAVVYDSIPAVLPPSYVSLGFQATRTSEFGDYIQLGGANRTISQVTVGLTNWACENWATGANPCVTTPGSTFDHPITLSLYEVDRSGATPAVGSLITSVTETKTIAFRPSANVTECGDNRWFNAGTATCHNGFNVTVAFTGLDVLVSNDVIVVVGYNTQSYGSAPIGANGPFNSLNVSLVSAPPTVGTDETTDEMFWNSTSSGRPAGLAISTGWSSYNGLALEIVSENVPAIDPLTEVTVYERDVKPNETAETYTSWHEGQTSDRSEVRADGLNLGIGGPSTVIKGTDLSTPAAAALSVVTRDELRALIERARVDVVSGSVTYQIPIFFGNPASPRFTTLRSIGQGVGSHGFSQGQTWATTRAFGSYTAQQTAPLGQLIDDVFRFSAAAGGPVTIAGYGVQADSAAVVSSVVWNDTRYTFTQPVMETCVPTTGTTVTNVEPGSWTFTETRTQGTNQFIDGGLRVTTFDDGDGPGSPDQRKAAGYTPIDIALSEVGIAAIDIAPGYTGVRPSLQLGFDADGNGTRDAYLVGEPWAYGGGDWSMTVDGDWADAKFWVTGATSFGVPAGGGYPSLGTLEEYLLANPEARITNYGYSLGSGVVGNAVIRSITVGCVTTPFTFELPTLAPPSVIRLAGVDRYATAVEISKYGYLDGEPNTVYIATGTGFADALSAVPAAAADNAPLLLTTPDSLPPIVAAELARLAPSEIVIVGGEGVVSAAVFAQLDALAFNPTVRRVAGIDRFATSQAIARDAFPTATTAYIATGLDFPDALAAGPAASSAGGPVILVRGTSTTVDTNTLDLLSELGVSNVVIAGGSGVVTTGIATQLDVLYSVVRNAGADRYATAIAINDYAFTTETRAFLATGAGFADALTGAAIAAVFGNPLYTSPQACLPASTLGSIEGLGVNTLVLLGGTGALSLAVENLDLCGGGTT